MGANEREEERKTRVSYAWESKNGARALIELNLSEGIVMYYVCVMRFG